jgi:outer membrane lipoprotein-sorting protein
MIGIFIAAAATQQNDANEVLARSLALLDKSTSVVGTLTQNVVGTIGTAIAEFHLKKGAKLAIFSKLNSEISDGIVRTSVDRQKGTYTVRDVRVFELPYLPGFEGFTMSNGKSLVEKFKTEAEKNNGARQPSNVRMVRLDGKPAATYMIGGSNVYLDPISAMPTRADFVNENGLRVTMRFDHVKTDVQVPDNTFTFSGAGNEVEVGLNERGMLKVGDPVPRSNSVAISMLNNTMLGKRNTVILFFDDKNAANGEMLQRLHKVAGRTPKDVAVIAVARTKNWRRMFSGRLNFTVIEDAEFANDSATAAFGVTKYPTLYVIDHQAEASYVQIGSNDAELNPILRGLGFSIP